MTLLLPVFADSGLFSGFHRPSDGLSAIIPTVFLLLRSLRVLRARTHFSVGFIAWMDDRKLYALYASKNRLCTLCGNTTPELTAYNAYRNANRRVRRVEGTKMYAVGDAYKAHTKCIHAYRKRKREDFSFYFFFILSVLLSSTARDFTGDHLLLLASSGIHGPHQSSLPVLLDHGRRHVRRSVIGGRSFERYIRIAHSHGKQNYHGRHHHRPPHSACGLRNRGGGGLR